MYDTVLKSYQDYIGSGKNRSEDHLLIQLALYIRSKKYEKNLELAYQDIENEKYFEQNVFQKEMMETILQLWRDKKKSLIKKNEQKDIFVIVEKNINKMIDKPELWKSLSCSYEYKIPEPFKIYRKLYLQHQKELRYCNSSIIVGFQNESNHTIAIEWGDTSRDLFFTTSIPSKQVSFIFDNKYPLYLFLAPYFSPHIKNISPETSDVSILYMWIPNDNYEIRSYRFDDYCYKNGSVELYQEGEEMPTLPFNAGLV